MTSLVWNTIFTPTRIEILYRKKNVGHYDLLKDPFCKKCSSPGVRTEDCSLRDMVYGFNRIYSIGVFSKKSDPYPRLCTDIRYLKDYKKRVRAVPLGYALDCLVQNLYPRLLSADFVIPVPSHEEKIKIRGFNHVELVMNHFCSKNNLKPLLCLNQIKLLEQRLLKLEQRYEAVKNAFNFNFIFQDDISDAYVILIDDVVTSGSTVSECSKVLKEAGASKVDVLTCGRNELNGNV